ncbi:endonuclease domain-containing protein [Neoaquamicrobium sediminum]|uniref:endonuclease domain-containing protein n=1 Tax=Neoaquamicrobium sediminum TaxID=1849104 RepID=UPI003BAD7DEF
MGLRAPDVTISNARRLRRSLSLPEALLWEQLRGGRLEGLRFRRQHAIGPYVLDFYCPGTRLAVEVDGAHHDLGGQMRHDNRRDDWLCNEGIRVLRIAARDVLDDHLFEGVLRVIAQTAATGAVPEGYEAPGWACGETPPPPPSAVPLPRFAGEEPASLTAAASVLPPFTGEGDHAKRGEGGVWLSTTIKDEAEGEQP